MLLEALFGGLIIGLWVSYLLLRFFDKIPAKDPVLKSILISLFVLLIVTISIGNPSIYHRTPDSLHFFFIGLVFNFIRILALGVAIGYGCKRKFFGNNPEVRK
jgi:branched-subunit amino acid ABC-type transport system permease component